MKYLSSNIPKKITFPLVFGKYFSLFFKPYFYQLLIGRNERITESFRIEKTSKTESTLWPITSMSNRHGIWPFAACCPSGPHLQSCFGTCLAWRVKEMGCFWTRQNYKDSLLQTWSLGLARLAPMLSNCPRLGTMCRCKPRIVHCIFLWFIV